MTQRYLWKLLRFNQAYYPTIIYCNIYGCKHTKESFYHITSATCFKGIENKETAQPCINFLPVQFIKQHRGYASKGLKRKETTELCIDIFKFQSSVPNQRRAKYRMICIKTLLRYHWPSTCWVFIMRTQENIMVFPPHYCEILRDTDSWHPPICKTTDLSFLRNLRPGSWWAIDTRNTIIQK